jgi:MoaA/NifB/PqqE/SkfB family radical SAM enzyme
MKVRSVFSYALSYAKNYLLEFVSVHFPSVVPKPLYVGLSVGTVCNLRCKQCDLWKLPTKPSAYLKTEEIKEILLELKKWLGPFRLTFTGAEPFVRQDIFEIIRFADQNDIETILTSNGYLIDKKMAKKIIDSGLKVMVVSLDGAKAKTHDFLRGKTGSYCRAIQSLRFLVKSREADKHPKIYVNTVISSQNLGELARLVELVKDEGLDGIRFEALESKSLFGRETYRANWFKRSSLWPKESQKTSATIDEIIKLKKQKMPILNTVKELKELKLYYQDPVLISRSSKFCFSGIRNFAIDEYGKVKLCFGMPAVGDLLTQSPKQIWYGSKAAKLRQVIRNCRRNCRVLPCNKREDLPQLIKAFFKRLK